MGCENGSILLLNLLYDEVLFTFNQTEGAISQITFLTDPNLGLSLMATISSLSPNIVLWDLNQRKIWA